VAIRDRATEADQPPVEVGTDQRVSYDLTGRQQKLPDWHPSGSDHRRHPSSDAADVRPLTDAEHAHHVADVKARLAQASAAGLATDYHHTIDPRREIWSRDRRAIHDSIINDLFAQASNVPRDGHSIVLGGLAGAGKSTVLNVHAGFDLSKYLVINPDLIKEEMARRRLVPQIDGLTPMEATYLVHEETSHIAKRLGHLVYAAQKNVIWDVTMSRRSSVEERITTLRAGGYATVEGIFIDVPIDVSIQRADLRHRYGHEQFRMGISLGGRHVPAELILAQADPELSSKNRRVFEELKLRLDCWSLYDNSVDGKAPILADSSERKQAWGGTAMHSLW
jgi:predicted ABC-type ATPase